MKRPLVPVTLAYTAGLLLAEWFQPSLALLFTLALGTVLAALAVRPWRRWLIWPLILLTGWANLVSRTACVSPHDLRLTQLTPAALVTVRGVLSETPSQRLYFRDNEAVLRTLAAMEITDILPKGAEWRPAFGRVLVLTRGSLPDGFYAGQSVEVTGVLSPPPGAAAPGLFDYGSYLRRQGVYFQLRADGTNDWRLLEPHQAAALCDRFLAWAQTALARGLPVEDESLRLIWAMTLGWKTALTNEVSEPFMETGTMHIFAISGLHIALIAVILVSLLRVARVPRPVCGLFVIPAIWFYTAATGWQPSAIRSTV